MTLQDILDFKEKANKKGLDLTTEPNMNEPSYVSEETRKEWEAFKEMIKQKGNRE